jgi:hypothetical protein
MDSLKIVDDNSDGVREQATDICTGGEFRRQSWGAFSTGLVTFI